MDVFDVVKEFFLNHEMSLDMVGSLCTDGAPVMLGNKSGFASIVKKETPHITATYCMLHRHALAAKSLLEKTGKCVINFCECSQLHQRKCLESSSV